MDSGWIVRAERSGIFWSEAERIKLIIVETENGHIDFVDFLLNIYQKQLLAYLKQKIFTVCFLRDFLFLITFLICGAERECSGAFLFVSWLYLDNALLLITHNTVACLRIKFGSIQCITKSSKYLEYWDARTLPETSWRAFPRTNLRT